MRISPLPRYKFGNFEFDAERLALYYDGELIKVEKKALQVLAILLEHPRHLTSTQEIIESIWGDNPIGVTSTHLAQSISKLRKVLADHDPDVSYIETIKGRGYRFTSEVARVVSEQRDELPVETAQQTDEKNQPPVVETREGGKPINRIVWVGLALLTVALIASAWIYLSDDDDADVRRVVRESQMYESLVLYRDPTSFEESDLDKYWTAETDPSSNYDRQHIRTGVRKLIEDNRMYGSESKNEQFEFQAVDVAADGTMAVVKTLEKWFIAEYKTDGTLLRNKNVGPYFVSYVLRKVDGRWLIEKSTTARANSPAPELESVEASSEIRGGQQFFVKVTGQRFEPQNVRVNVIGPGCPETNPCLVPNSAIRIHSNLSETALDNVPLTIAPGEYKIYLQNGESPPSNSLVLTVP